MSIALIQTALELGLFGALTTLALFLSYSMLNVCDLSTDGCFTLGATVGAVVAIGGHPWLSIPAAMAAGILSGFVVALLQTKMGINSLLAGIIVNTALYSINIAVMDGSSVLNMNKTETVFTMAKGLLEKLGLEDYNKLFVALIAVLAQDPRPSYQHDPDRVYGMSFSGMEIRFTVSEERLSVLSIEEK